MTLRATGKRQWLLLFIDDRRRGFPPMNAAHNGIVIATVRVLHKIKKGRKNAGLRVDQKALAHYIACT